MLGLTDLEGVAVAEHEEFTARTLHFDKEEQKVSKKTRRLQLSESIATEARCGTRTERRCCFPEASVP